MIYQSYKGRSIDFTKQVRIYKNLHNGLFSVMQNNLVVAHVESFLMRNVSFKVNEKARQRVIKEQRKNVHAFIIGTLLNVNVSADLKPKGKVTYNPYKYDCFVFTDTEKKALLHDFEMLQGDVKKGLFLKG